MEREQHSSAESGGKWTPRLATFGYEFSVFAAACWVGLSVASWPSIVAFVLVNLCGVALFDNYLFRRGLAMKRPVDNATSLVIAMIVAVPAVPLILGMTAPYRSLFCVALLITVRLVMKPAKTRPRLLALRRREERAAKRRAQATHGDD